MPNRRGQRGRGRVLSHKTDREWGPPWGIVRCGGLYSAGRNGPVGGSSDSNDDKRNSNYDKNEKKNSNRVEIITEIEKIRREEIVIEVRRKVIIKMRTEIETIYC